MATRAEYTQLTFPKWKFTLVVLLRLNVDVADGI